MKKQTPVSVLLVLSLSLVVVAGCGKKVDRSGGRFAITEPDPEPTTDPTPTGSPGPTLTPSPSATPFPGVVHCDENFSKSLNGIQLYSMESVAIGHVHLDAKAAIKGQSQLFQFSAGNKLSQDAKRPDLMLGDPTRLTSIRLPNGRCSTRTETKRLNAVAFGGFWKQNTISFETITPEVLKATAIWESSPLNGKVELRCGKGVDPNDPRHDDPSKGAEPEDRGCSDECTLFLIGWRNGANTFEISQRDVASAKNIIVDVPSASSAIVRVSGKNIKFKKREIRGEPHVQSAKVVWYFPGASEVKIDKSKAIGQWIIPNGKISADGFLVDGGIVTRSGSIWNTIASGPARFDACTPAVEP